MLCGVSYTGFTVGSTHVVTITTDAPCPPNAGAQLFVSTTTSSSGAYVPAGTATGPAPTVTAPPCICQSLG